MQFKKNKKTEIEHHCMMQSQMNYSLLNFYKLQARAAILQELKLWPVLVNFRMCNTLFFLI